MRVLLSLVAVSLMLIGTASAQCNAPQVTAVQANPVPLVSATSVPTTSVNVQTQTAQGECSTCNQVAQQSTTATIQGLASGVEVQQHPAPTTKIHVHQQEPIVSVESNANQISRADLRAAMAEILAEESVRSFVVESRVRTEAAQVVQQPILVPLQSQSDLVNVSVRTRNRAAVAQPCYRVGILGRLAAALARPRSRVSVNVRSVGGYGPALIW